MDSVTLVDSVVPSGSNDWWVVFDSQGKYVVPRSLRPWRASDVALTDVPAIALTRPAAGGTGGEGFVGVRVRICAVRRSGAISDVMALPLASRSPHAGSLRYSDHSLTVLEITAPD